MANYQSIIGGSGIVTSSRSATTHRRPAPPRSARRATTRSASRCRARSRLRRSTRAANGHRPQRAADSRLQRVVDDGLGVRPDSLSFNDALTWTRGAHTMKVGGEYRADSMGTSSSSAAPRSPTTASTTSSTTGRPPCEVALDSPVFTPQQFYAIGFAQDSWRARQADARNRAALRLLLGREGSATGWPSRSSSRTTRSRPTEQLLQRGQEQLLATPVGAYQLNDKTVLRAGFGLFYGPGQFEDRIQPIENYIERRRVQAADVPNNGLAVPGHRHQLPICCRFAATRTTARTSTTCSTGQRVARTARGHQPDRRLHGQPGQGHVPARRRQHARPVTRARLAPTVGQVDYKTSGCLDGLVISGQAVNGCG